MRYIADESFDYDVLRGASCAFGVFDGLHTGHRFLLDSAISTKDSPAARSVAVTFDIDPDEVFHPERLKKLLGNDERLEALEASGVDDVVVLPFTPPFFSRSPEEFLAASFPAGVPAHMHVGCDFRFGAKAAGTVDDLRSWGDAAGCAVHAHDLVSADGLPITATRIRKLLLGCDIREANRLLGHPYRLRDTVQPGRGQGADFGFATANLVVDPMRRVLGEGVYAAYAHIGDERYKAAVSVGVSPTFGATSTANIEVHVLDFSGNLVGAPIVVEFMEYLRPMVMFESTDELVSTVLSNIEWVRANL